MGKYLLAMIVLLLAGLGTSFLIYVQRNAAKLILISRYSENQVILNQGLNMAATPDKSGPTRRPASLAFPRWALTATGVVAAAGWMAISLLFLASSRFSKSGAGLPAGISSPLFAHLFLHLERPSVAMAATAGSSWVQMRPVSPSCRSRSPPNLRTSGP